MKKQTLLMLLFVMTAMVLTAVSPAEAVIASLNADGQSFSGYFEMHDGKTWLLIGRGREGWEFDTDGQGNIADVSQNIGTPAAFAPACYSDAIVNDLLSQVGKTMQDVVIRLSRASTQDGTGEYQDIRWSGFNPAENGDAFTWDFEDSKYTNITYERVNAPAGLTGSSIGTTTNGDTRDNNPSNDGNRVFTWAWGSHASKKGFSAGQTVSNGSSDASSFLWESGNENHAIPYTEVYIEYLAPVGAKIISPKYGEVVDPSPAPVTLEWENMDPNVGDSVYVDVWFGTDPNKNEPTKYWKLEGVSGVANLDNVTVEGLAPGIYYWQVDSYITGDPAVVTDPCAVEGAVYMFTNDGPVAIDSMVPDMITWSGQPLYLFADVNDDGGSDLTYLWSTDTLPAGVTAEFAPSDDVPNPTVTFIKDPSVIAIANAGFEDPVLAADDWNYSLGNQGWGYVDNDGYQGSWNPGSDFAGGIPEGANVGWANPGGVGIPGGFAQVLNDTLIADTTYTLTVEVGNSPWYSFNGYKVQLLAGGTPHNVNSTGYASAVTGGAVIAEDDSSVTVASGTFETVTVVYEYNEAEDANKVGLPLQIRLIAKGVDGEEEVDFDNVRLTANPTPPPSETPAVVTVKLTVNDETNPTVTDAMTIDVYDNACMATRIGQGTIYPGDFNFDCAVDFADLAEMAGKWLNDSSAAMTSVDKE